MIIVCAYIHLFNRKKVNVQAKIAKLNLPHILFLSGTKLKNSFGKSWFYALLISRGSFQKVVFQKLFMTLSSVGIMSIDVKAKSKIFNVEFQMSGKHEIASRSEACVLVNQKNVEVSHCLEGQLDTNLSPI